jgi:hypothetical protein
MLQVRAAWSPTTCGGFGDDLAALVAAWPELPEAVKAGIVAMVRAASPKGGSRFDD